MLNAILATSFGWIDGTIIVLFLALTFWVGSYFHKWIKNPDDFYVAGRNLTPFILAATLAATNINLYNFQSYVGYAYREGISIVMHEWTGLIAMVLAGLFILPILRRLRLVTIPELLGRRYGPSLRILNAFLWVFRLGVWLGGVLYLSAQIACVITGYSDTGPAYHIFIFILAILAIVYTMAGGMWAVVLTDVLQFVFLLGGALIMIPMILHTVGYWQGMVTTLNEMGLGNLAELVPKEGLWNWKGGIGIWLLGIQWATTDQGMLQRAFSSDTVKCAAKGMIYAGAIMIPFAFIIPMPGIAMAIKVAQGSVPAFLEQDNALPILLASGILPAGILGFILCGLFASQLSTIDSNLSSVSTLITLDIFNQVRKKPLTPKQTVLTLRLMVLFVGVVMILASYMAKAASSAIDLYISMISAIDMPLFVVAIIYGIFSKRATPAGALVGYLTGMLLGLTLQFHNYLGPTIHEFVEGIYHLYSYIPIMGDGVTIGTADSWDIALIGMIVTAIVVPVVSLFTKKTDPEKIKDISQGRKISVEHRQQSEPFHIWPISFAGRVYICTTLIGLTMFLTGLVLGKFPDQQGYGISKLEIHRFRQSAMFIDDENLPDGIVRMREEIINDLTTLAKNNDESDHDRKLLADSLVPRMKELMKVYSDLAKANPDKYSKDHVDEFNQRIEAAKIQPDMVIRENSKAGPISVIGTVVLLFGAVMRLRYD